jgi:hypothetical protein
MRLEHMVNNGLEHERVIDGDMADVFYRKPAWLTAAGYHDPVSSVMRE